MIAHKAQILKDSLRFALWQGRQAGRLAVQAEFLKDSLRDFAWTLACWLTRIIN